MQLFIIFKSLKMYLIQNTNNYELFLTFNLIVTKNQTLSKNVDGYCFQIRQT